MKRPEDESATAYIGLKILLSDLVLQINETNYNLIKEMLKDGFIDDSNNYFNEVYDKIFDDNKLDNLNDNDAKEYLIKLFTENGSLEKDKYNNIVESTLEDGCLYDQNLLIPLKKILSTDRSYHSEGKNGISRPLDFDLSLDVNKYKEIEKIEVVFILCQDAV